jgi:hypothetical protein
MAREAGAERVLPVHHQTFPLGREPVTEPLQRLREAAGANHSCVVGGEIGLEINIE